MIDGDLQYPPEKKFQNLFRDSKDADIVVAERKRL